MTKKGELNTGRFGRLVKLASVGARTSVDMLKARGSERVAEQAAEVLGNLRGLAAKLGQTASYVDGFIPEQLRQVYAKALGSLQNAAPSWTTAFWSMLATSCREVL